MPSCPHVLCQKGESDDMPSSDVMPSADIPCLTCPLAICGAVSDMRDICPLAICGAVSDMCDICPLYMRDMPPVRNCSTCSRSKAGTVSVVKQ
jgi:hypothetical protein